MKVNMQGSHTLKNTILMGVGFFIQIIFITPAFAADAQALTFKTPKALLEQQVKNKQDSILLLGSENFKNQLLHIAEQINADSLTQQPDSQVIGLSSMLGQFDKTLAFVESNAYPLNFYHYSMYAKARQLQQSSNLSLHQQLKKMLAKATPKLSDENLHKVADTMGWSLPRGQDYMLNLFSRYQKQDSLSVNQALDLLSNYQLYKVYEAVLPVSVPLIKAQQSKRYVVQKDVLINTADGATLSALVVKKRGDKLKRPTAFRFTIYADEKWNINKAMHAAAHGYVGVVGFTRGKYKSPDDIVPWEHDGKDATTVIDWIAKQEWSDGQVGMYGGSYLGFTQWAAAKYMHPALKTIVPIEAAHPFVGLPVENNIFITPNYQWAFHVSNNKTMDQSVYNNWKHWQNAYDELFTSGRAFKDIDKVEGTSNPWFQKWLSHPGYDRYYQDMLPYQQDYKNINIPVLSITGYFGASISALHFFSEHYQYNNKAKHSLLIGPYSHGTAQGIPRSHHRSYKLDKVALKKDTQEIAFAWFDHVFFNKAKPKLIKDKVNYQLMGSNSWQHKSSLEALNQQFVRFHLGNNKNSEQHFQLTTTPQNDHDFVKQVVDLSERETPRNEDMWQIIQSQLNDRNGLTFISPPFDAPYELAGAITGYFALAINKKDVDIGFTFYEVKANGETFKLTRYISRASYAKDMNKRQLLIPNQKTLVPIVNSTMMAKLIGKDSRLAMVLNVNKNSGAQVNMGTGKDVSEETIDDAGVSLEIKWFSDSQINVPLKPWKQ